MRCNVSQTAEVAVIGGGPAGAACAIALGCMGRSVVLIEKSAYDSFRIGETLPPAVQPLLTKLCVWEKFLADNHSRSFGICSDWGGESSHRKDFMFSSYGSGWHIDRPRFDAMLAHSAAEAGARLWTKSRLLSCERLNDCWRLEIACAGRTRDLRAQVVVDASGRASHVARKLGAKRLSYDRLIGVVFLFSSDRRNAYCDSFTWIEAVADGWWYFAKLPRSRAVLVYMTDADLFASQFTGARNFCVDKINSSRQIQLRVKGYDKFDGPFIFPANSSRLDRASGEGWLAIGDSAMAFDPLSGQGVYRAVKGGYTSAKLLGAHLTGDTSALVDYAANIEQVFNAYLSMKNDIYSTIGKWRESVFWQRRTG